jgi:hypothetical protein
MTKYKFQNFNLELIDPIIEDVQASYKLDSVNVQVHATLKANDNKLFGVYLGEMQNTDHWTDETVIAFATAQLETFKI